MEERRRVIRDEKELLDIFLQKTISSMFEIPTQGRNNFSSNKVALESEVDKYLNDKITPQDKDFLFSELDKVVARIQDFSVVDLKDPLVFANEENLATSKKEEIIASRYSIQVTASDLKRIQNGNYYNTKLVDFYVNYLSEKLLHRVTHSNMIALPSLFFSLINTHGQVGNISSSYQQVIELLITKSEEIRKGEQNIFRLVDRLFFVANLSNTHWTIVELQKANNENRRPVLDQSFEGFRKTWNQPTQNKLKKSKYLIILHDSLPNYVKPEENETLKTMKTFLMYTMGKWGMKIEEDDFEVLYGDTVKQEKVMESGAYICKFLDLLYQKKEQYDSPLLTSVKPLDIEYAKNELRDLIQSIGHRSIIPESIFSRF